MRRAENPETAALRTGEQAARWSGKQLTYVNTTNSGNHCGVTMNKAMKKGAIANSMHQLQLPVTLLVGNKPALSFQPLSGLHNEASIHTIRTDKMASPRQNTRYHTEHERQGK